MKPLVYALLGLVVLFSFLVRFFHTKTGLPYLHYWDEPMVASTALHMLKSGDLHPRLFNYGSFIIYVHYIVDILHFLYLMGRPEGHEAYLASLSEIQTLKDTKWRWTISHPSFYHWNRVTTALFGTVTVVFTYLTARLVLKSEWLALVAAAFLGALGYHAFMSARVTPDVPVTCMVLAAVYFALAFMEQGRTRYLVGSLMLCGMIAATKINNSLVFIMPALAVAGRFLADRKSFRASWLALLPIVPLVTFLVVMPYAFLDRVAFVEGVGREVRHYGVRGHGTATIQGGLEHIRFQLGMFHGTLGTLASILAAVGLAGVFLRPMLALVLVFPVLFFFYMTQMVVNYHRNFIPLYPFLAILVASSFLVLPALARRIPAGSPERNGRIASYASAAALSVILALAAHGSWSAARAAKNTLETRSLAIQEANRLGSDETILIAAELRIHEQDLRKLTLPYRVLPIQRIHRDIEAGAGGMMMVPAQLGTRRPPELARDALGPIRASERLLARLDERDILVWIGGEEQTYYYNLSIDPGVILARTRGSQPMGISRE